MLIDLYKQLIFEDLSADFVGFHAATCHFNTSHSGVFSADFDWKLVVLELKWRFNCHNKALSMAECGVE